MGIFKTIFAMLGITVMVGIVLIAGYLFVTSSSFHDKVTKTAINANDPQKCEKIVVELMETNDPKSQCRVQVAISNQNITACSGMYHGEKAWDSRCFLAYFKRYNISNELVCEAISNEVLPGSAESGRDLCMKMRKVANRRSDQK